MQTKNKKPNKIDRLLICDKCLAGDESLNWHPLIADFIIVGRKLEELGFIYDHGRVLVLGVGKNVSV